ncbi:MAG: hypothetical protein AAB490_03810 [Patescibacteria group bacterium]
MTKFGEQPRQQGQPAPELRPKTNRDPDAYETLLGPTMIRAYFFYRARSDSGSGEYTMEYDPMSRAVTFRNKQGEAVFAHEQGDELEKLYLRRTQSGAESDVS